MTQQTHSTTHQTQPTTLRVKTHVKAGGIIPNHNATLVRVQR